MLTHIWNIILKMKMAKPLNCKKSPAPAGLFFWIFLRSAKSVDFEERGSQAKDARAIRGFYCRKIKDYHMMKIIEVRWLKINRFQFGF